MKVINSIKWNDCRPEPRGYEDPEPYFGWIIPAEKHDYELLGGWQSCRELFIEDITDSLYYDGEYDDEYIKELAGNLRKLRVAVVYSSRRQESKDASMAFLAECHTGVERAIKIINVLEEEVGWRKSTVAQVDKKKLAGTHSSVYVFEGSGKWLYAPPLLSLYLLCVRLGSLKEFANFEISMLAAIAKKLEKGPAWGDSFLYRKSYSSWLTVLKNAKELFFCRPLKENYIAGAATDGINNMIAGKCAIPGVKQTWDKIIKENKE
jgi:hypothetical protein